jgi:hypothetical protein
VSRKYLVDYFKRKTVAGDPTKENNNKSIVIVKLRFLTIYKCAHALPHPHILFLSLYISKRISCSNSELPSHDICPDREISGCEARPYEILCCTHFPELLLAVLRVVWSSVMLLEGSWS